MNATAPMSTPAEAAAMLHGEPETITELIAAARRSGMPHRPRSDPHAPERPPAPHRTPHLPVAVQDAIVRWVLRSGGYQHLL